MMIDYKVSDHWPEDTPGWLPSLVSSLDRRHGLSVVLPLTVIVSEIAEWVQLASGTNAWSPKPNRASLALDLDQSVASLGPALRAEVSAPLAAFEAAFAALIRSPSAVLEQPPGTRSAAVWGDVMTTATALLTALDTDAAARASWDDLVAVAQDRTLARREYRPIAELLFDQLQRRGHVADRIFDDLVSIMAFGRDPDDIPMGEKDTLLQERLVKARDYVGTPTVEEPTVVWLGYKGRITQRLEAGDVAFHDGTLGRPKRYAGTLSVPA